MTETLWNSMYSRYYRSVILANRDKLRQFGEITVELHDKMQELDVHRLQGVQWISNMVQYILSHSKLIPCIDCEIMHDVEQQHQFLFGVFSVRNQFVDKLCYGWTSQQLLAAVKRMKFLRVPPLTRIVNYGDASTGIYFVLRGGIRIFKHQRYGRIYHQDLFSGEIFGEDVVNGVYVSELSAFAVTNCEIVFIPIEDFVFIQSVTVINHSDPKYSNDHNINFLMQMDLLRHWEPYKLYKLAENMTQVHYSKGVHMIQRNQTANELCFIMSGGIHIVTSIDDYLNLHTRSMSVISTLQIGDYFGEIGVLNALMLPNQNFIECHDAITATPCDVLVISSSQFYLLEDVISSLNECHVTKMLWRNERLLQLTEFRESVKLQEQIIGESMNKLNKRPSLISIQNGISCRNLQSIEYSQFDSNNKAPIKNSLLSSTSNNHSQPVLRSLAICTTVTARQDLNIAPDNKEFVRNLSKDDKLQLCNKFPSKLVKCLPPIIKK